MPRAPSLRAAARGAAVDFYFNSWRLVPANALWGGLLLLSILVGVNTIAAIPVLMVALAVPTVAVYRLAALIVREDPVAFSDALQAYRGHLRPALVVGLVGTAGSTILLINVVTGFVTLGGPLGWAIGTAAFWGLVILWAWVLCLWPLITDPRREGIAVARHMRLAGLLVLAFPLRVGALGLVTGLVVVVSTVLFAVLVTIALGYCALLGCRYVLPAADRLEGRATARLAE